MLKNILVIIGILFFLYLCSIIVFLMFYSRSEHVEIAAHRGDAHNFPENTMPAFESAYKKGADYIELDLHQTKDNVIVVLHDETLDRTTNGTGSVKDYTYEEIKRFDAGNGSYIPTFQEVLNLAVAQKGKVIAEIKSPQLYPGIEDRVYNLIKNVGFEDRVIIASFDRQYLEEFRGKFPSIATCAVYGWKTFLSLPLGGSKYVCLPAENMIVNPWHMYHAQNNDKKVFIWFQFFENGLTKRLFQFFRVDGLIIEKL